MAIFGGEERQPEISQPTKHVFKPLGLRSPYNFVPGPLIPSSPEHNPSLCLYYKHPEGNSSHQATQTWILIKAIRLLLQLDLPSSYLLSWTIYNVYI